MHGSVAEVSGGGNPGGYRLSGNGVCQVGGRYPVSGAGPALPEELREIVYLKYAQELTMREIAKVLNIPMRTVQSKLRRALGILKCEEERAWGRKNGLKLNSLFLIF
ncbi:MAG: sigma factor-like helix-turn-helix DNA-binding protein [Dorea sp.]